MALVLAVEKIKKDLPDSVTAGGISVSKLLEAAGRLSSPDRGDPRLGRRFTFPGRVNLHDFFQRANPPPSRSEDRPEPHTPASTQPRGICVC